MSLPVGIVGGGGFGRALAQTAARVGRQVVLWSRSQRNLGSDRVRCTTELAAVAEAELVFIAVPSPHVRSVTTELGRYVDGSHLVVHVSRGLIGDQLGTLTSLVRETTPVRRVGVLAGPLVASALAEGEPGGGIVGTLFPEVAEAVREAIAGPSLRIYSTPDVIGVEMASAFVGLVALALGWVRGAGLGPSALATFATRAVAESTRLGVDRGASERTFSGLAGYGDLIAAVAGDGRPELLLGEALAEGVPLEEAAKRAGAYVEGVAIAKQAAAYALQRGLSVPIARAIARFVDGEGDTAMLVKELMARPTGTE